MLNKETSRFDTIATRQFLQVRKQTKLKNNKCVLNKLLKHSGGIKIKVDEISGYNYCLLI